MSEQDPIAEAPPASYSVPVNLGERALASVGWNYIAALVTAVTQLLYTIVMSRLVSPEAFGLVAMTVLARGIGSLLSRMGIGSALVQKPDLDSEDVRAGFTSSVALGVFYFALFWVLAPSISGFFEEPRATSVIRGTSVAFIAAGLLATPESLLTRELRFKELSLLHIVSITFGYFVVGIGSALAGAGVWALVFAPIAHVLLNSILVYMRVRHPLRPTFAIRTHQVLLSYGSRVSLIGIGDFFGSQLDTVIVGRYSRAALLGMYNRAFYLTAVPLSLIMSTASKVLFSSFSQVQNDAQRLKRAYLSSARVSAALFLPISAFLGSAATELIVVLLGEPYRRAADVVPFFAVFAAMHTMTQVGGALTNAKAHLNHRLAMQFVYILLLGGGYLAVAGGPLWRYGAVLALGESLRHIYFNMFLITTAIPAGLLELFNIYRPSLLASGAIVLTVVGTRIILVEPLGMPASVALIIESAVAAVTFLGLTRIGPLSFLGNELRNRLPAVDSNTKQGRALAIVMRTVFGPAS
jgi:O-antigen/teichoic acid export membrane protein